MKKICESCNVLDDEEHRLNVCTKWLNHKDEPEKVPFEQIFTNDLDSLNRLHLEHKKWSGFSLTTIEKCVMYNENFSSALNNSLLEFVTVIP